MKIKFKPSSDHAPNRRGQFNRVRLIGGGPLIDVRTAALLGSWHKRGISVGALIDRLVDHARRSGFDPAKDVF